MLYSYPMAFGVSLTMECFCFCEAGFYRLAQALVETGDTANATSAIEAGLRINSCECGARSVPPNVTTVCLLYCITRLAYSCAVILSVDRTLLLCVTLAERGGELFPAALNHWISSSRPSSRLIVSCLVPDVLDFV